MKVLLFKGPSEYGALTTFIDDLAEAFRARGDEAIIYEVKTSADLENLEARLAPFKPVDLAYSMTILSDYKTPDGRSISEILNAPMVVQYVDHPLTHLDRLRKTPAHMALLVLDKSHVRALQGVFGATHFAHIGFSPTAAMGALTPLPDTADEFMAQRPIPVLFTGTYYAPGAVPWADLPNNVRAIFDMATQSALEREWLPAHEALEAVMKKAGLSPKDESFTAMRAYASFINEWVRTSRRVAFFEAAARVGLPLTVYGKGYDEVLPRYSNIDYRGPVDFSGTIELMRQSRLVININANFGEGAHDRPFSAMMAGAVAVTDQSAYYRQEFTEGRDIAFYRWKQIDADLLSIKDLLHRPETLLATARAGQKKANAGHGWGHRIPAIVRAAELARARIRQKNVA